MALQITTNINVDFYDNKYIMINAKQYDDRSRLISITCYNQGDFFNISSKNHTAYIKYRKADGRWVLNCCTINHKGQVLVELTEQMLAASGICYVDLFIVNKGSAIVNIDTGSIVTVDGSSVLTTKAFYVDVQEAVIDNSLIESSDGYDGLTNLISRAEAEYSKVIQSAKSYAIGTDNIARENDKFDNAEYYSRLSKSYAIGNAGNTRRGENTDNSKYYSEQSFNSANKSESYAVGGTGTRDGEDVDNAEYYSRLSKSYAIGGFDGSTGTRDDEDAKNAKTYMDTTKSYMDTTEEHMNTTDGYMNTTEEYMNITNSHMDTTKSYMDTTKEHMDTTSSYMDTTKSYMDTTEEHMNTTDGYMNTAKSHMDTAKSHMDNAKISENNALNSANSAQSYAVGGTGTRDGEDVDNAEYYYEKTKSLVDSFNSGFMPNGTIAFSELATVEKITGYVYNINEDFVTDDTFKEGAGKFYTAGTNVYCCLDNMWDCFSGSATPTATVDEVKSYLGILDV